MLLVLFACSFVVAAANPFHKYPFVFLLDIGNEELENSNKEQISVSLPGGSLAVRHPAIGDGDEISHVRVTGIDFGTDLKANIIEGGPGYKYVVLVLMGNPGAPYDAVVTIQTIPSDKTTGLSNLQDILPKVSSDPQVSEDNDPNDSAEDLSDDQSESTAELTSSSSKVYNYVQNEVIESDDNQDDAEEIADDEDVQASASDNDEISNENDEVKDYATDDEDDDDSPKVEKSYVGDDTDNDDDEDDDNNGDDDDNNNNDDDEDKDSPKAEKYSASEYVSDESYKSESVGYVDSNLYEKYEALKPHLFNAEVYPLEKKYEKTKSDYRDDGNEELDQMFNDEEIHNDGYKFKDSNNNYFDSDDSSAVEY